MKKFVNDPKQFVPEMLKGIALANPDTITYVPEYNLIMRSDAPNSDKVSIVQGSGSGHEPAHVMVVGKACLTPPAPVTSSPLRPPTTCSRRPSASPPTRASCCW